MKKNRKLFLAWSIFLASVIAFVLIMEIYHNFRHGHSLGYHYRILIDKDLIVENEDKNQESVPPKEQDSDTEFYEQTKYGYLPKISPKGEKVFDKYSARSEISSHMELRVVVLIDENNKASVGVKLNNQKVTFIIPCYINQLNEVVKTIRENGHEFFLQMPTQTSVPESKKETVSPFLANDNLANTQDKLFSLLASTKYALGIANISPTLFTKSLRDMAAMAERLASRGLAFFDVEKSNYLAKDVAQKSGLIYINPTFVFESADFDISKLKNGDILMIRLEHLENLMQALPKNWILTSVSASVKSSHVPI
jgi:polysaccharide deacetylase 2 family uncharacterized protein YibQ